MPIPHRKTIVTDEERLVASEFQVAVEIHPRSLGWKGLESEIGQLSHTHRSKANGLFSYMSLFWHY